MNHESRLPAGKAEITNHARRRGFTIIEMVVVFAIIAIMSVTMIVSINDSKVAREVEAQSHIFAGALREAQNLALTGRKLPGTLSQKPCKFEVASTAGSGFSIQQYSFLGCATMDGPAILYSLNNGVIFSAVNKVQFRVPRGEPLNSAGVELDGIRVDFSLEKSGKKAHVCVYPLGRVEETRVGNAGSEPQCS